MADFDETGAQITYIFVKKDTSVRFSFPGATTQVLDQILRLSFELRFNPSFVGCDKDKPEINAIQRVWPSAKVQICFWHAKRAIITKMKGSSRSDTLLHYAHEEAEALIPNLEICWGSYPSRRPYRHSGMVA